MPHIRQPSRLNSWVRLAGCLLGSTYQARSTIPVTLPFLKPWKLVRVAGFSPADPPDAPV